MLPAPALGTTWTRPADSMVMVYVPAGEFEMGSMEGESDEQPVHTVALDGFWIDRTEVTNGQYAQCEAAGACDPPPNTGSTTRDSYYGNSAYDNYPVIYVSWHDAEDYCAWAGARLPTEAQWEYAARGPESRVFPWGDEFDCTLTNSWGEGCDGYTRTAPVGSFPAGASWCGALDMIGNVWEWVADWYDGDYYERSPTQNPLGPEEGNLKVLRGGSWGDDPEYVRGAYRRRFRPDYRLNSDGFRCARGSE